MAALVLGCLAFNNLAFSDATKCGLSATYVAMAAYAPFIVRDPGSFNAYRAEIHSRSVNDKVLSFEVAVQYQDHQFPEQTYVVVIDTTQGRCDVKQLRLVDQK
jgi:hypothetical protein